MNPLRQCLLDTYLVRLRAIARFWDIDPTESHQREAALELAEGMSRAERIADVHGALLEEETRALDALLASDGQMPDRIFTREWGEIRPMGPGKMERERPWEELVSPAEGLWYKGFLFRSFEQGPDGTYEAVFVPPEMRAHLPTADPADSEMALEPVPEPTALLSLGDRLADDACTLLSYVQNERPRLVKGEDWPRVHRKRLLQQLRVAQPRCLQFLTHLARRLGWLAADEADRLRLQPEPVTIWLKESAFHQQQTLVEAWRDDSTWNDLFQVRSLQPEDTGAWHNDPLRARKAILSHIAVCAPNQWYRLQDFVAGMKQLDPDFQRPTGDYESWYIRDRHSGEYLAGFESWEAVEGRLIRHVITRPMTWLGLVELGSHEREWLDRPSPSPAAFRVTTLGAALLGFAEPVSTPLGRGPRLRTGFEVFVPATRRYERFQIARIAEWARSGDCFTYRLTPESLERARGQGISVPRVLEFLDETTDGLTPRVLKAALSRWAARGTEAWLERPVLLRLGSEELMSRAVSSRHVGHLIQERLGPTTALVRERDWHQVVAGLRELGLLPQVSGMSKDSR